MLARMLIVVVFLLMSQLRGEQTERRLLYVAEPGIRNYTEYGGHGVLVFDIDNGHKFVRRIATGGVDDGGKPINVKGIAASAVTGRLYVSTIRSLTCLDLVTEAVLWERSYPEGCDRMALSPDGKTLYLPSFEKDHWYVLDARSGDELARVVPRSGAHNTVYGADGESVYLAGLRSPLLSVASTSGHRIVRTVGPFAGSVRPFTINRDQSLCFVNVNGLLGFEIGDLQSGRKLHRVEVQGFEMGKVKRHGCPSHGVGMTPDEKEIWVTDGHNSHLHIFEATVMPPRQVHSIKLREQPGWVTFSIDGTLAYPSTGDVIDVRSRKIITGLTDEQGRMVMSEKLLEIDFVDGQPLRAGNQFGVGQAGAAPASVFAKWNRAMDAFRKQDAADTPPAGEIVFVGSSSIRLWDTAASFPDLKIINRGFGGSDMADSLHFADLLVVRHKPRVVAVYAGDNDIARGKSAPRVVADFRRFCERVHAELPETRIVYIPIKPSLARWDLYERMRTANEGIRAACEQSDRLVYVDLEPAMLNAEGTPKPDLFIKDGLHLNAAGYRAWTELLRPHLVQ